MNGSRYISVVCISYLILYDIGHDVGQLYTYPIPPTQTIPWCKFDANLFPYYCKTSCHLTLRHQVDYLMDIV